jgi:hypothetical protein
LNRIQRNFHPPDNKSRTRDLQIKFNQRKKEIPMCCPNCGMGIAPAPPVKPAKPKGKRWIILLVAVLGVAAGGVTAAIVLHGENPAETPGAGKTMEVSINFSGHEVDDAKLKALVQSGEIPKDNPLIQAQVDELQRALPDCKIYFS